MNDLWNLAERHDCKSGYFKISLLNDLLAPPANLPLPFKYVVMNGVVYFATGALFVAWPGLVQRLFLEPSFVGHEDSLFRIIGMTLAVIGWLYGFVVSRARDNSWRRQSSTA